MKDEQKTFGVLYVTGGARSGKSTYALERAKAFENKVFVATAEPCDDEMERRIKKHREERRDDFAATIEEPVELAGAVRRAAREGDLILVDCLTVWLGNLFHKLNYEEKIGAKIDELLEAIKETQTPLIAVSNELGMGLVPPTELGRAFRDAAGRLNQRVARLADEAVFMVSGLPVVLKG